MSGSSALPVVESLLDLRGPQFKANWESWQPILEKFEAASKYATTEATPSSQTKHQSRGQLLGEPIYTPKPKNEQRLRPLYSSR